MKVVFTINVDNVIDVNHVNENSVIDQEIKRTEVEIYAKSHGDKYMV